MLRKEKKEEEEEEEEYDPRGKRMSIRLFFFILVRNEICSFFFARLHSSLLRTLTIIFSDNYEEAIKEFLFEESRCESGRIFEHCHRYVHSICTDLYLMTADDPPKNLLLFFYHFRWLYQLC